MKDYQIVSYKNREILYAGRFQNFRACVEQAVSDRVSLRDADLSNRNLSHAELDGGDFRHARFIQCNLSGANTSECRLSGAQFNGAIVHGTVFCESDLRAASFNAALFGATDFFASRIDEAIFSTLSAFSINFLDALSMRGSHFQNPCGTICPMSRPPLVIQGLQQPVIFLDRHIKIGHAVFETGQAGQNGFFTSSDHASLRLRLEQYAAFRRMPDEGHLTFHKRLV